MKKLMAVLITSVLALGFGTVLAAPKSCKKVALAAATKPTTASFLFTLHAKKAGTSKNKNGSYTLTMDLPDIDQVIAFTDRPYRTVKYVTGMDLQKLWSKGKNSFTLDPPNAVLTANGLKTQIIVLNSILVTDKEASFTVYLTGHGLGKAPQHLKDVNLVIDAITVPSKAAVTVWTQPFCCWMGGWGTDCDAPGECAFNL